MECREYTGVTALTLIPQQVEDISQDPEILKAHFAKVECMFWKEGDTSLAAGNVIVAAMKLFTTYSPSEMSMCPTIRLNGEWEANASSLCRICVLPRTNAKICTKQLLCLN